MSNIAPSSCAGSWASALTARKNVRCGLAPDKKCSCPSVAYCEAPVQEPATDTRDTLK